MKSIVCVLAALAVANAGILVPSTRVIQGASSRSVVAGPDGSVISSSAPGGRIIHEEHPGYEAHVHPIAAVATHTAIPVATVHHAVHYAPTLAVGTKTSVSEHSETVATHSTHNGIAPVVVSQAAGATVGHATNAIAPVHSVEAIGVKTTVSEQETHSVNTTHTVHAPPVGATHHTPVLTVYQTPVVDVAPASTAVIGTKTTVSEHGHSIAHSAPTVVAVAHAAPVAVAHAAPVAVAHAAPVAAAYAAPVAAAYAAPVAVAHAAPVAVAHAAPVAVAHAAPVAVAHAAPVAVAHDAPVAVADAAPVAVAHSAPVAVGTKTTVSEYGHSLETHSVHSAPVAEAHAYPALVAHSTPVAVAHSKPVLAVHPAQLAVVGTKTTVSEQGHSLETHSLPAVSHVAPAVVRHVVPVVSPHPAPLLTTYAAHAVPLAIAQGRAHVSQASTVISGPSGSIATGKTVSSPAHVHYLHH